MKWLHDIQKKHEDFQEKMYIRQHPQYPCSQQLDELRKELNKMDGQSRASSLVIIGTIITAIISIRFFPENLSNFIGPIIGVFILPIIVLIFGVIVVAIKIGRPHVKNAIYAIDKGQIINTSARIEIIEDDENLDKHYVIVEGLNKEKWRFFFSPSGWRPTEGVLQVKAYFLDHVQWPVLLIGEAGIMYPTSKPKKLVA